MSMVLMIPLPLPLRLQLQHFRHQLIHQVKSKLYLIHGTDGVTPQRSALGGLGSEAEDFGRAKKEEKIWIWPY